MRPDTLTALNRAMERFLLSFQNLLEENAGRSYVKGGILGDIALGISPDRVQISTNALDFARNYGELLRTEGASVIGGQKVTWLKDFGAEQRNAIDQIIEKGLKEGRAPGVKESGIGIYPKDSIAADLQGYFDERKSHASTVARTETGRIQNLSSLDRWNDHGVTEVDVLDDEGPHSCNGCQSANAQRWTLEYAMEHELEHPNCVRAFNPVRPQ